MDKSGCFLKHFLPKALCEKEKNVKLNKSQSKEWLLRFSLVSMVVKLASQ